MLLLQFNWCGQGFSTIFPMNKPETVKIWCFGFGAGLIPTVQCTESLMSVLARVSTEWVGVERVDLGHQKPWVRIPPIIGHLTWILASDWSRETLGQAGPDEVILVWSLMNFRTQDGFKAPGEWWIIRDDVSSREPWPGWAGLVTQSWLCPTPCNWDIFTFIAPSPSLPQQLQRGSIKSVALLLSGDRSLISDGGSLMKMLIT